MFHAFITIDISGPVQFELIRIRDILR